ncbi:glycosyl hydrolase family 18 protein [Enterocloster sp. OA13]|uniref:glycosyl hydrolase family 18 protein n=1 Tax=Enterocloster TaxID=2719313 RepID=UPI00046F150A|nr:glycosyl hydrolase family 18 protein [Lachnoclostridium pacaense]MCC2817367.1 SH3 domain-containing protein [Lachnoclostridium pacaense]MCH1951918.1 glycosyl hydrolase family 18 protein [Enterocloster sp. OA13]
MGRRRKGHGCAVTVLVLLLLLMAAGGAGGYVYIRKYMPTSELSDKTKVFGIKGSQVALLLDNELQEEKGIYEDGQVYLPVEWVNEYLNQRFYWDEGEKLLVYALPESIVYADEDAQGEKGPLFKVTDDGMYLSLGLVVNYTDIRTQSFATSQIKRVFIDTLWEPYDTAVIKKAGQVREKGGVKSPILTELEQGESVDVLETMEKWSRVRTEDGYIGYIENRRLEAREQVTPQSSFEAPVYTSISMDEKVRLGFHQVTRQEANSTLESYVAVTKDMNVIVPTWFNVISDDGTYNSLASKEYVDKAHGMGLQVWAMVENVSTQESVKNLNTKTLMSSTSTRRKLIENLMKEADTYGFDGFNLDFESLKAEAGPHYVQFIRELSVSCRQKGLVLSVDNYVPSSYSAFYNRREQGIVADYVIIMGYDEHYAGGEAGPVASISYVKDGIGNTLKEVPKEKVINAVPFYTRVWTVNEGKTTSKAYGIVDARQWVADNHVELAWDEGLGLSYGSTVNGNGEQYIWMEDEKSMALKIGLVKDFDLAGVACWKLGFESSDIWDIVSTVK